MIINFLINAILVMVGGLASFFPEVFLPTVIREPLITVIGYWNSFMLELPFLVPVWNAFLWILSFELFLLILKFFLGHRTPINTN